MEDEFIKQLNAIKKIKLQPKIIPGQTISISKHQTTNGIYIIEHTYDGKKVKSGIHAYDDIE